MLRIIRLIWIIPIISLFIVVTNVKSQGPIPSNRVLSGNNKTQTYENKKYSKNNQRGTEQFPLIFKVIPSQNTQEEATQAKKEKEEQAATNRRVEITTYIVASATGIQAIVLIWTVIVMLRTTRRQLRAYVFVDTIDIGNITDPLPPDDKQIDRNKVGAWIFRPNIGPITFLTIKNSGKTPAYDVINLGNICIKEFPLTSTLPPIDFGTVITKSAVPANGIITKYLQLSEPLTEQEVTNLRAGIAAIYVYGKIYYKTFGKKKVANFRFMHFAGTGIIGLNSQMTICEEGNDAD